MIPANLDPNYSPLQSFPRAEQSYIVKYKPQNCLSDNSKVEFSTIKSNDCVDLSSTTLSFTFRVVNKSDGKPIEKVDPTELLGACNDLHSALCHSISISINNNIVTQTQQFRYLSHIINNLNYTSEFKKSCLYVAGFVEESAGTVGNKLGAAFISAKERLAESGVVYVSNKINSPLFQQKKLLPPNCELGVSIILCSEEQLLIHNLTNPVKLEILSAELTIKYVKFDNNILNSLSTALQSKPYHIPIKRTDVKTALIPASLSSFTLQNLFLGTIPSRVIVLMVENSKQEGNFTSSCFEFSHFNLQSYEFHYNNISIPVVKPQFNGAKGQLVQLYEFVNQQLGISNGSGNTPMLTYDRYIKDSFILCQSFLSETAVSQSTLPGQPGSLGLTLNFSSPLAANVCVIIISEFNSSYIELDFKENSVKVI